MILRGPHEPAAMRGRAPSPRWHSRSHDSPDLPRPSRKFPSDRKAHIDIRGRDNGWCEGS